MQSKVFQTSLVGEAKTTHNAPSRTTHNTHCFLPLLLPSYLCCYSKTFIKPTPMHWISDTTKRLPKQRLDAADQVCPHTDQVQCSEDFDATVFIKVGTHIGPLYTGFTVPGSLVNYSPSLPGDLKTSPWTAVGHFRLTKPCTPGRNNICRQRLFLCSSQIVKQVVNILSQESVHDFKS